MARGAGAMVQSQSSFPQHILLRIIAVRRDSGRFVAEPQQIYDRMRAELLQKQVPIEELFWCEDEDMFLGHCSWLCWYILSEVSIRS